MVRKMAKILLAEDNPADVCLIRTAFEEHEIHVTLRVAADGGEVLRIIDNPELLDEADLKLIILDLKLPRHDGVEILQRLRQSERLAHVPVVILTSSDSPRDRTAAGDLGALRFLRKPSNLEEFLSLGASFRELLGQAESEAI
jgi:two-component system, chemotaxis family, response regulator Rcp1